jgi:hypothetical protein
MKGRIDRKGWGKYIDGSRSNWLGWFDLLFGTWCACFSLSYYIIVTLLQFHLPSFYLLSLFQYPCSFGPVF